MFVSFVTGAFGIIHPVLGKLAGLFSYPLLRGINLLVSFFGRLSFAAFPFKLDSLIWLFIFYAVIFDLAYILRAKRARQVV
jgi:hypothetical protein